MEFPRKLVETTFLKLIDGAHYVRRGSTKLLMNGRCPICEDSKKSKRKMRFYLWEKGGTYCVDCKNCFYSKSFYNFLRSYYPEELEVIKTQCFSQIKSGEIFRKQEYVETVEKLPTQSINDFLVKFFEQNCIKLDQPQTHALKESLRLHSINILKDRCIDEKYWKNYYFCFEGKFKWRIIIPFVTAEGLYYNFQARDIHPTPSQARLDTKYIFAQFDEIELPDDKIYNKYSVNPEKVVFVCEGIFKSLFLPNAVALCNANVRGQRADEIKKKFRKRIWVLDSPWIDQTGYESTLKLLEDNEICFVIPKEHKDCKDVDELAKKLKVDRIPAELIKANLYKGTGGLVKLKLLKQGL